MAGKLSLRAQQGLQRAANAGRAVAKRVREREKQLKGGGLGLGGAFIGSGWWAERRADEDRGGDPAAFELGPVELDGMKIGIGVAAAGLMGLMKDDVYDTALFGTGIGLFAADRAITRYKERLAEPPE